MAIKNKNDRAAQGLTEADERMAEEAMAKMVAPKEYVICLGSVEVDEGISVDDERVVHTPAIIRVPDDLSNFSLITERLFGTEEIIIYNSHEFRYYGPKAHRLGKEIMSNEVSQGKAYFGGSEQSGYFGTSYDALNIEETIRKTCNYLVGMEEPCFLISEDLNCPEEYKNACADLLNELELARKDNQQREPLFQSLDDILMYQYDLEDLSDTVNESEGMWSHKPYTVTDIVRSESGDITSLKLTDGEGRTSEVPVKDNKIIFGNKVFDINTGKVTEVQKKEQIVSHVNKGLKL